MTSPVNNDIVLAIQVLDNPCESITIYQSHRNNLQKRKIVLDTVVTFGSAKCNRMVPKYEVYYSIAGADTSN